MALLVFFLLMFLLSLQDFWFSLWSLQSHWQQLQRLLILILFAFLHFIRQMSAILSAWLITTGSAELLLGFREKSFRQEQFWFIWHFCRNVLVLFKLIQSSSVATFSVKQSPLFFFFVSSLAVPTPEEESSWQKSNISSTPHLSADGFKDHRKSCYLFAEIKIKQ